MIDRVKRDDYVFPDTVVRRVVYVVIVVRSRVKPNCEARRDTCLPGELAGREFGADPGVEHEQALLGGELLAAGRVDFATAAIAGAATGAPLERVARESGLIAEIGPCLPGAAAGRSDLGCASVVPSSGSTGGRGRIYAVRPVRGRVERVVVCGIGRRDVLHRSGFLRPLAGDAEVRDRLADLSVNLTSISGRGTALYTRFIDTRLAFLLCLVSGTACSDSERSSSPTSGVYRRLALSPADDAVALPLPTTLARYAGRDELAALISVDRPGATDSSDGSAPVPAKPSVRVKIPGPFPHDDLLRLSLTVTGSGVIRIQARALAGEEVLDEVTESRFKPRSEPRTVDLDFSKLRASGDGGADSVDRIEVALEVETGRRAPKVRAVTVSGIPLSGRFSAGARDGSALIFVRGEMRRATCLAQGRPLVARFVGEPGTDLIFSHVVPNELRVPGRVPLLVLTLSAGERTIRRELPMPKEPGAPPAWAMEHIPLEEFAGREVEARFELQMNPDGVTVCALGEPALVRRDSTAPTVLVVTSDTHRADHVGGLPRSIEVETPAIAALAREGVSFLDAYSTTNNTTPSHVALFTGRHPRDTGIVENGLRLSDAAPTLAERFREAGYATLASISAAPVDHRMSGLGQGFDRFFSVYATAHRDSSESIADVLASLGAYEGVPLFVWVHVYDAHGPYEAHPELSQNYYSSDRDPRDTSRADAVPELAPYWDPSIVDPHYTEALYRGEVTYLDQRLAELFDHPRFLSATIAFTSDHGETLRRGWMPFEHKGISPSTLAVPLILRSAGVPAGSQLEQPVRQMDVGRTLLDLAGLGASEFPGRNLLEALEPEPRSAEPRFAIESFGLTASVQFERWMLVLKLRLRMEERKRNPELKHAALLYDVRADPYLQRDVASEHSKTVTALRARLVDWLAEADDTDWSSPATILPEEEVEKQLVALGYATEEGPRSDLWFDTDCQCPRCEEFR